MYYEERVIDGVLHCRGTPDGEWRLVSAEALTSRLLAAETALKNHQCQQSCRYPYYGAPWFGYIPDPGGNWGGDPGGYGGAGGPGSFNNDDNKV